MKKTFILFIALLPFSALATSTVPWITQTGTTTFPAPFELDSIFYDYRVGVASTSAISQFAIEMNGTTTPFFIGDFGSSTPFLAVDTFGNTLINTVNDMFFYGPSNTMVGSTLTTRGQARGTFTNFIDWHPEHFANPVLIVTTRANGTAVAPTTVLSGQEVFKLEAMGYDGTLYSSIAGMTMVADPDQTYAASNTPGQIIFKTTTGGSDTLTDRVWINSLGKLGVGTSTPWGFLSVDATNLPSPAFTIGSSTATSFIVNNAGIVGIGTTTPWASLAINPLAGLAANRFVVGSSTATDFIIKNDGKIGVNTTTPTVASFSIEQNGVNKPFYIGDSGTSTPLLQVNARGNVSINTASDSFTTSGLPLGTLFNLRGDGGSFSKFVDFRLERFGAGGNLLGTRADGTAAAPTTLAANSSILALIGYGYDGTDYEEAATIILETDDNDGVATGANDMPGRISLRTTPDGSVIALNRVTIDSNGRVGVNADPDGYLSIFTTNGTTTDSSGYAFEARDSAAAQLFNIRNDGVVTVVDSATSRLTVSSTTPWARLSVTGGGSIPAFAVDGASGDSRLLVTAGGDIGIASTTPSGILSVEQGTEATTFIVANNGSSTPSLIVRGVNGNGNVGINTSTPSARFATDGKILMNNLTSATGGTNNDICISTNGDVVNETTGVCVVSSERFKHDIKSLNIDALNLILALKPVAFKRNGDDPSSYTDKIHYGLTAENVAEIDPHLASYGIDKLPRGLDEHALISLLIKAIQELDQKTTQTTNRIEENWQWIVISLLGIGLVYQQIQIAKIKRS